jgi:hypothetical protein
MQIRMNHDLYHKLMDSLPVSILTKLGLSILEGFDLIRVDGREADNTFEIALISKTEEKVIYYNKVIIVSDVFLNSRPATQILLWRTVDPKYKGLTAGLAEKIFFEYIIETYDIIMSDNIQTEQGMFFWQTRLLQAIDKGLFTYLYDYINGNLFRLNRQTLEEKNEEIWGEEEDYQYQLAVISKFSIF